MKTVAFLSRLALICNLLFVVCLILQRANASVGPQAVDSTIIVLGWILAPLVNAIAGLMYLWRKLARKPLGVQPWMAMTNCVFFVAQVFVQLIFPS